jgi:hypothetical protein
MTTARSRVATGTAGGAGGPCEVVGFGVLPAGHQPRGERGPVVVEDDAAGAAQVSLRVTTASAAAHSPGAHAATARRAGADCCARGRGDDVLAGHADIMGTTAARTPISDRESPRCGPQSGRMPGTRVLASGQKGAIRSDPPQPRAPRRCGTRGPPRATTGRRGRHGAAAGPGRKGPLAHPPELTYPCCLPALGEFGEMMPHEGSAPTLAQVGTALETRSPTRSTTRPSTAPPGGDSVGEPPSGILVALLSVRTRASSTVARRIRLVAYGARLESVLG